MFKKIKSAFKSSAKVDNVPKASPIRIPKGDALMRHVIDQCFERAPKYEYNYERITLNDVTTNEPYTRHSKISIGKDIKTCSVTLQEPQAFYNGWSYPLTVEINPSHEAFLIQSGGIKPSEDHKALKDLMSSIKLICCLNSAHDSITQQSILILLERISDRTGQLSQLKGSERYAARNIEALFDLVEVGKTLYQNLETNVCEDNPNSNTTNIVSIKRVSKFIKLLTEDVLQLSPEISEALKNEIVAPPSNLSQNALQYIEKLNHADLDEKLPQDIAAIEPKTLHKERGVGK